MVGGDINATNLGGREEERLKFSWACLCTYNSIEGSFIKL